MVYRPDFSPLCLYNLGQVINLLRLSFLICLTEILMTMYITDSLGYSVLTNYKALCNTLNFAYMYMCGCVRTHI